MKHSKGNSLSKQGICSQNGFRTLKKLPVKGAEFLPEMPFTCFLTPSHARWVSCRELQPSSAVAHSS